MNFCTWALRHRVGCGQVQITSLDTHRTVTVPVVDFCDCYTGTPRERIVDLQWGVVSLLNLQLSIGLYPVTVQPPSPTVSITSTSQDLPIPDTAMRAP